MGHRLNMILDSTILQIHVVRHDMPGFFFLDDGGIFFFGERINQKLKVEGFLR